MILPQRLMSPQGVITHDKDSNRKLWVALRCTPPSFGTNLLPVRQLCVGCTESLPFESHVFRDHAILPWCGAAAPRARGSQHPITSVIVRPAERYRPRREWHDDNTEPRRDQGLHEHRDLRFQQSGDPDAGRVLLRLVHLGNVMCG